MKHHFSLHFTSPYFILLLFSFNHILSLHIDVILCFKDIKFSIRLNLTRGWSVPRYKLFSTVYTHIRIPNHTNHELESSWILQYQSTVLALISRCMVLRSAEHNSCPALSCLALSYPALPCLALPLRSKGHTGP